METLKNVLYAGVGLAQHTEDKMKGELEIYYPYDPEWFETKDEARLFFLKLNLLFIMSNVFEKCSTVE